MIQQRTNQIQINEYILPDYNQRKSIESKQMNTNYSNYPYSFMNNKYNNTNMIYKEMMESKNKHQNDIDQLIENNNKEFDINNIIQNYRENINKKNEEIKNNKIKQEQKNNVFIQQMILENDLIKKRREEMNLDFERRMKNLEDKRNKDIEIMNKEHQKRIDKIHKESLERQKKHEEEMYKKRKFDEEIRKKDEEINSVKLGFLNKIEHLNQKHYEEQEKLSKDLTEEKKKYYQMKYDFNKAEKENKLLSLDNNHLKNINQMNQEYIQYLNNRNNNRNQISYTLNYNNYYGNPNDNQYDNTNYSQAYPYNSNSNI